MHLSTYMEQSELDSLLQTLVDGLVIVDLEGEIIYANIAAERILELSKDKIEGRYYNARTWQQIDLEGSPFPLERLPLTIALREHRKVEGLEHGIIAPDGEVKWLSVNAAPLVDEDGQVCYAMASFRDITEYKQNEIALRESEARYRTLASNFPNGIVGLFDQNLRYTLVDGMGLAETGLSRADFEGKTLQDIYPPEICRRDEPKLRAALRGESTLSVVPSGDQFYQVHTLPVQNDKGEIAGGMVMTQNITELKQTEAQLRHRNQELTALTTITTAINQYLDLNKALNAALKETKAVLNAEAGIVYLFDEQEQIFSPAFSDGVPDAMLEAVEALPFEETFFGRTVLSRESVVIANLDDTISPSSQCVHGKDWGSWAGVSIRSRGQTQGVLVLISRHQGHFNTRHYELLGHISNQIGIALEKVWLYKELEAYNAKLERTVRKRTAELQSANAHLEKLSKVKDEFVSNISHELRSPITSLKLRQYLLKMQPENHEYHLNVIRRETERLEHIIEGLLNLSGLDQGRITASMMPVDLNVLVGHYVSDRAPAFKEKDIHIAFEPHPSLPHAQADESLIEQMLGILLSNALNYTPQGGEVVVHTGIQEKLVGFSVSNTGPGIPSEEQEKLFERFYRGKVAKETNAPGTGLGLAIAKEIIELHQGHLEVESQGISGCGATFSVWLNALALNDTRTGSFS